MLKRGLGCGLFIRDSHLRKKGEANKTEQRKLSQCDAGLMKPCLAQLGGWGVRE